MARKRNISIKLMHKILLIFGTRPEAIKLCPVVRRLREEPGKFDVRVCVTAQHREMLDQVLQAFEVKPDRDLDLMLPGQTLFQSTSRILAGLEKVLATEQPALVVVQGDTTTTLRGALAGFYSRVRGSARGGRTAHRRSASAVPRRNERPSHRPLVPVTSGKCGLR
jgi:UDP-N-acetylglucosamine 2-epimerase (non-hydrolysing)